MLDFQKLAQQCLNNTNDPKVREQLNQVMNSMQSGQGTKKVPSIPAEYADQIERAAAAAQSGNKQEAMAAISQILSTPEGAKLADQLKFLMGK